METELCRGDSAWLTALACPPLLLMVPRFESNLWRDAYEAVADFEDKGGDPDNVGELDEVRRFRREIMNGAGLFAALLGVGGGVISMYLVDSNGPIDVGIFLATFMFASMYSWLIVERASGYPFVQSFGGTTAEVRRTLRRHIAWCWPVGLISAVSLIVYAGRS